MSEALSTEQYSRTLRTNRETNYLEDVNSPDVEDRREEENSAHKNKKNVRLNRKLKLKTVSILQNYSFG